MTNAILKRPIRHRFVVGCRCCCCITGSNMIAREGGRSDREWYESRHHVAIAICSYVTPTAVRWQTVSTYFLRLSLAFAETTSSSSGCHEFSINVGIDWFCTMQRFHWRHSFALVRFSLISFSLHVARLRSRRCNSRKHPFIWKIKKRNDFRRSKSAGAVAAASARNPNWRVYSKSNRLKKKREIKVKKKSTQALFERHSRPWLLLLPLLLLFHSCCSVRRHYLSSGDVGGKRERVIFFFLFGFKTFEWNGIFRRSR